MLKWLMQNAQNPEILRQNLPDARITSRMVKGHLRVQIRFTGSSLHQYWLFEFRPQLQQALLLHAELPTHLRGKKTSVTLLNNVRQYCLAQGISHMRFTAQGVGSYVWLCHGALPLQACWQDMRLTLLAELGDNATGLKPYQHKRLEALLQSPNRKAARALAQCHYMWCGQEVRTHLRGLVWQGEFIFAKRPQPPHKNSPTPQYKS